MALREIVLFGHPILRLKTKPVDSIDDELRSLISDMIETMQEVEGIGLAAPQIANPLSICVINYSLIEEGAAPRIFINPRIISEHGSSIMEEGCLSIPEIREDVERPENIQLKYQDIDGVEHIEDCDGMLARVLLHEIDHLNGVLFIDRISSIKRKMLSKRLKKIAAGRKSESVNSS